MVSIHSHHPSSLLKLGYNLAASLTLLALMLSPHLLRNSFGKDRVSCWPWCIGYSKVTRFLPSVDALHGHRILVALVLGIIVIHFWMGPLVLPASFKEEDFFSKAASSIYAT